MRPCHVLEVVSVDGVLYMRLGLYAVHAFYPGTTMYTPPASLAENGDRGCFGRFRRVRRRNLLGHSWASLCASRRHHLASVGRRRGMCDTLEPFLHGKISLCPSQCNDDDGDSSGNTDSVDTETAHADHMGSTPTSDFNC